MTETIEYEKVCSGVRELVRWLNSIGFKTTDSGDGTHFKEGMEGAFEVPMVAMKVHRSALHLRARRLEAAIGHRGLQLEPGQIQATYDPVDDSAVILLIGVISGDVGL